LNRKKEDYQWKKLFEKLEKFNDRLDTLEKKTDYIILQKGEQLKNPPNLAANKDQ
jgi:hypothetical protein